MKEVRSHNFGILGTVSKDGRPHATGVAYGPSASGKSLALYVVTDTGTKKVRNILRNPYVSFVIPIPRRVFTMAPMNCVQFQGKARVLTANDEGASEALRSTRMGRMMLEMSAGMSKEQTGGHDTCIIMIAPDPVIHTYGIGMSLMQMRRHMGEGRGRVEIPSGTR